VAAPVRSELSRPYCWIAMAVIEVEGLRKDYRRLRRGRTVAVDGLDLSVPQGGVFGFLGPNGAGKTTTIRCLLGLVRPTSGRCMLLGARTRRDLAGVIGRVGSIVETPALYPRLSGRRNLELLGRVAGVGRSRVGDVLAQVGLRERADDLVKNYSLGMRQRLGIGAALLKDPELLILDEPANGLDPAGIVEVRDLIRRLGREGRTVFVSSHILSEIQQTADHVAILSRGRSVAAGPVDEVLSAGRATGLIVRVDDVPSGLQALLDAGIRAEATDGRLRVELALEEAARVTRTLADRGLYLTELRPDAADLETVFLELTAPAQEAETP
jgi:ABC-2 type transport system ATP-binding protein